MSERAFKMNPYYNKINPSERLANWHTKKTPAIMQPLRILYKLNLSCFKKLRSLILCYWLCSCEPVTLSTSSQRVWKHFGLQKIFSETQIRVCNEILLFGWPEVKHNTSGRQFWQIWDPQFLLNGTPHYSVLPAYQT